MMFDIISNIVSYIIHKKQTQLIVHVMFFRGREREGHLIASTWASDICTACVHMCSISQTSTFLKNSCEFCKIAPATMFSLMWLLMEW